MEGRWDAARSEPEAEHHRVGGFRGLGFRLHKVGLHGVP